MAGGGVRRALDAGKRLDERTGAYLVGELFWIVGPFIALAWVVLGTMSLVGSIRDGAGSDIAMSVLLIVVGLVIVAAGVQRFLRRRRARRGTEERWARVRSGS